MRIDRKPYEISITYQGILVPKGLISWYGRDNKKFREVERDCWVGWRVSITVMFLLFIIGLVAGAYGTIVGAGGGFIFVPALLLLFGLPPTVAAGTGLVVVLINALSGVIGYIRQKRVHYRYGLLLSIAAIPGTFLGVWLSKIITGHLFYLIFAFMLMGLGLFLLVKKEPKSSSLLEGRFGEEAAAALVIEEEGPLEAEVVMKEEGIDRSEAKEKSDLRIGHFGKIELGLMGVGFLLGIIASFFGTGGGWLMVPILIYVFKVSPHDATATSVFSLSIYSLVGAFTHGIEGNIDWTAVLWGGLGVLIGSQFGVYFSRKLSGRLIVQMLAVLLVFIGATMIR